MRDRKKPVTVIKNLFLIIFAIVLILCFGAANFALKDIVHHAVDGYFSSKKDENAAAQAEHEIARSLPKRIDDYSVLEKIKIDTGSKVFYYYVDLIYKNNERVSIYKDKREYAIKKLTASTTSNVCSQQDTIKAIKNGYTFSYLFRFLDDKNDEDYINVLVSPEDC